MKARLNPICSVEVPKGVEMCLWTVMKYVASSQDVVVETPWGGGGDSKCSGSDGTRFKFSKTASTASNSSVHRGQIPLIFYI